MVILNITHGDHPYCSKKHFLPIAAGACRDDILNDACGDDNISDKNKYYGDFTSLYWAWKNLKGVDIIGTSHYRRYISPIAYLPSIQYDIAWQSFCTATYPTINFRRKLIFNDIILVKSVELDCTVEEQYKQYHSNVENLKIIENILLVQCPEYLKYWQLYLKSNKLQYGFLFITKWQYFDELCTWIYPILEEFEKRIDVQKYDGYQSRVVGYIYERLVPVYIKAKKLKVAYMPMLYISKDSKKSLNNHKRSYWYTKKGVKPFIKQIKCFLHFFQQ